MTSRIGSAIRYMILSMVLTIGGLLVTAASAHAHGSSSQHVVDHTDTADVEHVKQGHPEQCHGGSICNAVGLFSIGPPLPAPKDTEQRYSIPRAQYRVLGITAFDPPPPRVLI
ncbi:hypothetical protein [Roseibium sp. RKSG952]|uniref:hypothetical protein n=1 Tax=Roseibium sp. RKSG952 TaxID=2529384 RepID=UPI0012BBCD39|nr:hypothetical protein [Roseibium sp. RKSG952]MTI03396.1 hypothetical protein [Roseibium sp. RKSG952]